ncbi:hypothetical protein [Paenibacillus sp. GP183]|uniref:hypothetical protein n=1 Tax=Paenibacillus sp. GP183 TaxID=1882751 RepID=UPI0008984675|nr:hypothetical protein [Paenibacillus sp. GP183]SEC12566.1 hypothetical protein SAMN05443246_3077 [Paenibacillus sp. GP183]
MENNLVCIYDNTVRPKTNITNIIGNKRFDEVIFKGKSLKIRFLDSLKNDIFAEKVKEINEVSELYELISQIEILPVNSTIIHVFSKCVIHDIDEFEILIKKAKFIKQNIIVNNQSNSIFMFINTKEYIKYLNFAISVLSTDQFPESIEYLEINSKSMLDISIYSNFMHFISGSFDARFFNSLQGDEITVVKSSTMKAKISSEYHFYHLLPENMKMWFVLPYNYNETDTTASYTMERYNMSDMAIKWIHGSVGVDAFDRFLKKVFYFVKNRNQKEVLHGDYNKKANSLYIDKLDDRLEQLKAHKLYKNFDNFVSSGTSFNSIDEILDKYKGLYDLVVKKYKFEHVAVIGHGDLCFSNMLYDNETALLRLIDPKGALEEEDLWTNPYYDIAKLSHSVCGLYDFFNSGLYNITLGDDFRFKLTIDFDNSEYVRILKKHLADNGFNYAVVRVFETSLFLSMLPLHMDNPKKVFGFLLNAINILNEVETYV